LMLRERFDEAELEFRAAIESDPQYAEALNNLGTSLGRQAKNSEAAQSFREAIAISPQYTQALVNLGLTLAAQANYAEAERQLQNALKIIGVAQSDAEVDMGFGGCGVKTNKFPKCLDGICISAAF